MLFRFKSLAIFFLTLGAVYFVWHHFMGGKASDYGHNAIVASPPSVGVTVLKMREIRLWGEFSGRLSPVDSAVVRPRVAGIIERVHFKDGQVVKKGDKLFTIDQRPYRTEVARAEAQLASAKAEALAARREITRTEKLVKLRALSQREIDQRRSALEVAEANIKVAESALDSAKLKLEYSEVCAPIGGRIGRAEITQGNLVDAGGNAPVLTTIVDDTKVYADFDMDEASFLRHIKDNAGDVTKMPVELGLANETGTPHKGHVESFDNKVNTSSGTIRVRAIFENPNHVLVPGLFARLMVGGAQYNRVLLVSEKIVGTDQNKKFVLTVSADNKVEYREIKLGPTTEDGMRVVEDGLKEGDRIIISGLQMARPGMPVKAEDIANNPQSSTVVQ